MATEDAPDRCWRHAVVGHQRGKQLSPVADSSNPRRPGELARGNTSMSKHGVEVGLWIHLERPYLPLRAFARPKGTQGVVVTP